MPRRNVLALLDRLAATEERFLRSEFLAPALPGGVVFVRFEGIVCRLRLPGDCRDWSVFRPTGPATAAPVRPATLTERQHYLKRLPRRRVVLCRPCAGRWEAWPAHAGDRRFGPPRPLSVHFVEEAQAFDVIEARFDGVQAWFDRVDSRADPATAAALRQEMTRGTSAAELRRRGLTAEERAAYGHVLALRQAAQRNRAEERLKAALAHAGAELTGYVERDDVYRVEYAIDGARHVSVVGKDDLAVRLAGICLSGADAHFDLASLVGVLREADAADALRIGADGGLDEGAYWRAHPPR